MAIVPNISSAKKKSPKQTTPVSQVSDIKKPVKKVSPKQVPRQKPKSRKRLKKAIIILSVVVLIGCILGYIGFRSAKVMYTESLAAKDDVLVAQTALTEQRFTDAADKLGSAEQHFIAAQAASDQLFWIKWVPWVSTQFKAVDNLLLGGSKIASALQSMSYIGNDIFSAIESDDATISNITPKQRKDILEQISASPEALRSAQSELAEAVAAFDNIPDEGVIAPLAVATIPIKEKLPLLEQIVDKAIPFLEIAPGLVGYPEEKTYLFLLQNNSELRPTGGFIGTYGILVLKNGDIKEFKTDNIYNLDVPVKNELFIDPPEPFATYLGSTQWFMRDANWDPDFPTTAEKVEEFYHLENGPIDHIDGVIAMTPEVIHDLLGLTGPITINGDEYTVDNLTEKLQYQVEVGYQLEGISDSARKEVVGKLANELMSRMLNLPKNKWGDLWKVSVENLDEKHLLIYSKDEQTRKLVDQLGWDGAIKQTDTDYVSVIDANLAALKTDRVMTKNLAYAVSKQDDKYKVTLTMKYYNDGIFDTFTTRYRSYTRIYVPSGSELITSKGFLTNDRYLGGEAVAPKVTQNTEMNKTVFEGFISVEPKSEETISLEYYLPDSITQQIDEGNYGLYWQKQSGTNNVNCDFTFDIGENIESADAIDEAAEISDNKVHFSSPLDVDKTINIEID